MADELLDDLHVLVQLGERHLRLHHPELHGVAAGVRLLGAEGGAEAVDATERADGCLAVELAGLRQIGRFLEVLGREQVGRALGRRRRDDRRVHQHEALVVQPVADRADQRGARAQDGGLARVAQPEVAVVEQKVAAVLAAVAFGRQRVGIVGAADNLERIGVQLKAARRALFGPQRAGDAYGRLQRDVTGSVELLFGQVLLEHDALHDAGAVAQMDELQAALVDALLHPAGQRDILANVVGGVVDFD